MGDVAFLEFTSGRNTVLLYLSTSIFDAKITRLDVEGCLIASRLKVGDLDIAWVLGFLGLSSRVASRFVEFDPFVRDRMFGDTKEFQPFQNDLWGKLLLMIIRRARPAATAAWPCFYFGYAFRPPMAFVPYSSCSVIGVYNIKLLQI